MRATFKNAKDGKQTNLMVHSTAKPIDMLVNDLYTKYELFRDNTGYYYRIIDNWDGNDTSNSNVTNNVTYNSGNILVNLFKIKST